MVVRFTLVLFLIYGIDCAVDLTNPKAKSSGSPYLVLEPKNGKTNEKHPAPANNTITMFCGAKQNDDDKEYLPIDRAEWWKYPTVDSINLTDVKAVEESEKTGSAISYVENRVWLNITKPLVTAAGKYRCDVFNGKDFMAKGNVMVQMRPVFVQEDNKRLDVSKDHPFELNGGGYTVTVGGDLSLSCRALGNPEPTYKWEKEGKQLRSGGRITVKDHVLNITGVTEEDRSVYKCIASNTFKDAREPLRASVEFTLRIKGKLAWLWPLIAIIVTAVLLAIIIIACEYRRKKHEQETRELEPEEDD